MYDVYKITSPSGRVYIGISSNIKRRVQVYKWRNCKSQILLYRSIMKYGWKNHRFEILEKVSSKEEAMKREILHIKPFQDKSISLNLTKGGEYPTESLKVKIYQYTTNKNFIREYESIEQANKLLKVKGTISSCISTKTHFCKGYLWFKDKEGINFLDYKPLRSIVYQFDTNGKFIREHASILDASKAIKCRQSEISLAISKHRHYCQNYLWFLNKEDVSIFKRKNKGGGKKVALCNKDGSVIEVFPGIREAARIHKIQASNICEHINGKRKLWKEKLWRLLDD